VVWCSKRGGKNAVVPLEDATSIPIYQMASQALNDSTDAGLSTAGHQAADSATQSAILDRRGVGREDEKREILARTLESLGDKVLSCLQANLPKEIAIRIAGPDGRTWRKTVSRPDIQGQFKNWIDIIEMSPWGQSPQAQEMLALLNLVGPEMALASEDFSQDFFRTLSRHNPNIAADFTEMALLFGFGDYSGKPNQKGRRSGWGDGARGRTGNCFEAQGPGPEAAPRPRVAPRAVSTALLRGQSRSCQTGQHEYEEVQVLNAASEEAVPPTSVARTASHSAARCAHEPQLQSQTLGGVTHRSKGVYPLHEQDITPGGMTFDSYQHHKRTRIADSPGSRRAESHRASTPATSSKGAYGPDAGVHGGPAAQTAEAPWQEAQAQV
jgi:hypothetical protein